MVQDVAAELMAHERECAVRWESVERRLVRLERVIWVSNVAIVSALVSIVVRGIQ
jgi:hypothetical protein